MGKTLKIYLQVIIDVCVKTVVLEICFGKKTNESVVETITNISTGRVHC